MALSLVCLLLLTASIFAQDIPDGLPGTYESTPLSNPGITIDSILPNKESQFSFNQTSNVENLTNSAQIVGGSNLVTQAQANQIAGYLNQGNITLTNIFSKTSGDGKTSANFHAAGDGQGRTITVYRVQYNGQQYLIGGYNPQSWSSINNYNVTPNDTDRTAFLFNLTSDFVQRQKLTSNPSCGSCGQYQTYNTSSYGPTFGGGHDIWVDNSLQAGYAYNWSYGDSNYSNNILNIGNPYTGYPSLQILGFEVFKVAQQVIVSITPQSSTTVGNCYPFGTNDQYRGFMGFIYRNVPAFTLNPGDQISFDLGALNDVDIRRNIYFATANMNPSGTQTPQGVAALSWTKVVSDFQTPLNPRGNTTRGDYELTYTAESSFTFNGGGFIIGFSSNPASSYVDNGCEQVLVSTSVNDSSGNFYSRFYGKGEQTLGTLDNSSGGAYDYFWLGGFKIFGNVITNTAPTSLGDSYSTDEDTALNIPASGVLGNDSDNENDALTAVLVSGPTNAASFTLNANGSFSYMPNADFNGSDSFTYKANDGQADSNIVTVTITVNAVNDAPVLSNVPANAIRDEEVLYSFTATVTDVDSANLQFSLLNAPAGASIDATTGAFSWTPTEAQGPGIYNFTVRVSDGALNADANISVEVSEVNIAPTLSNVPGSATIDELAAYTFTATASDPDIPVNTLTFSLVGAPSGASINPSTGAFSWTPTEAQGDGSTYNFSVRVSDGVANTDQAIALTVNEVNSAPVLAVISDQTIDEETLLSVAASGSDTDDPANTLTYSLDAGAPDGMTIDAATGAISWTPTEAQGAGDYPVTVRVTDNGTPALDNAKTFNVHVNEVNIAPELAAIGNKEVDEMTLLTFTAAATDVDLPANGLSYSLVNAPAGTSIDSSTGVFTWTPTEAQGGNPNSTFTFTVKVTDDGTPALSDEETIIVTVNEVNVAPVLGAISNQNGYWGNAFGFTASATDADIPANTLTFSLDSAPAGASIDSNTGAFSWTPTMLQIGMHTFTVRVTDNGSPNLSDKQSSVTINVGKRPTTLVYTGDGSEQYSDSQALSATLTDNGGDTMQGSQLSGKTVGFVIGSQNTSAATSVFGSAANNLVLTQDPAPIYTVGSSFAGDDYYLPSGDSDAFDIVQEDARVYYTGTLFASTSNTTSSTATVTLAATIKDITAVTGDAAYDTFEGDIRNARVTFVDRDTNAVLCTAPGIGLVSASDTKVGTANCVWNANIGNLDSDTFRIGIKVNNYYLRDSSDDDESITVSKPLDTNFITGGGYIVNGVCAAGGSNCSTGQYAGAPGLKTNFGFNVKYNKSGKNLQGRVNIIVRNGGRVYQIKGTVMDTLSANNTNPSARTAVFTGKANISDITDPYNPIPFGGNATLQMNLTDKGEPGSTDTVGVTVWNNNGGLLFSSKWNGTKTIEQILGGGNLVVR